MRRPSASVLMTSIVTPFIARTTSPGTCARPPGRFSVAGTTAVTARSRPRPAMARMAPSTAAAPPHALVDRVTLEGTTQHGQLLHRDAAARAVRVKAVQPQHGALDNGLRRVGNLQAAQAVDRAGQRGQAGVAYRAGGGGGSA